MLLVPHNAHLQTVILDTLIKNFGDEHPEADLKTIIESAFTPIANPLDKFSTTHKRMKNLQEDNSYVPPTPFTIGNRVNLKEKDNVVVEEPGKAIGYTVNLEKVFTQLFRNNDSLLAETKKYMETLYNETENISNFIFRGKFGQRNEKIMILISFTCLWTFILMTLRLEIP